MSIDISSEPWDTDNYATSTGMSQRRQLPTSSDATSGRNEDNTTTTTANDDDDGDDITEIGIEDTNSTSQNNTSTDYLPDTPEGIRIAEDRRRELLVADIQRMQKTNLIHFAVLFLVPTAMVVLVIWTALSNDGDCDELIVGCVREPRTFVHAFTSRCLCKSFEVAVE